MALDMATVKQALGDKFDPDADYIVSGDKDVLRCRSKGYREIGDFMRGAEHHIVFDRRPATPPAPPVAVTPPVPPVPDTPIQTPPIPTPATSAPKPPAPKSLFGRRPK